MRLATHAVMFAVLVMAVSGIRPGGAQVPPEEPRQATEVLVRLRDETSRASSPSELGPGAVYNEALGLWRVPVSEDSSLKQTLVKLASDPGVETVQPNHRYERAVYPDDPLYVAEQAPRMQAINAPAGWDIETGSADVVIAVIDGGVDITHPELSDRIWINTAEVPANGLDDDKNKCVDDVNGCNITGSPPNGDVMDRDGHGTFVSGAAAANTNNGIGTAGVAWNATIMPVRTLDANGFGDTEQLAESILYAAHNGADVINMSLALIPTGNNCPEDKVVQEAMRVAHDEMGALMVSAAGNSATNCVSFPGRSVYSMAVGASGLGSNPDARAPFSQWGPEVDVVAPGQAVTSTCPLDPSHPTSFCNGPQYGAGSGTSFSTPMVSGLAALLLSQDSSRTPVEVTERIRETARDMPDGANPNWDGSGMIDVAAALGATPTAVFVDVRSHDASMLGLSVIVGDIDSPECEARLWTQPDDESNIVHGTFGASECGPFWPPSEARPWHVTGTSATRKAARLTGAALVGGGDSCPATDAPRSIGAHESVITSIDCDATGIVANDTLANATVIPKVPRRAQQDVRYATSVGDPTVDCADFYSHSTWYRLPAKAGPSRAVAADTFGSAFDTIIAVFRDTGGALEQVACNEDYNDGSRVVFVRDGTSDYVIMVASFETVPGGLMTLNVSPANPPANDSQDQPASFGGNVLQAAHHATSAPSDPEISCATDYGYSVWFDFTVTAFGDVAITTEGSNYDTVLAVFRRGENGDLTEVACNEDVDFIRETSLAVWNAQPGEHLILVGSFRGRASGVLNMSFTEVPGP